MKYLSATIFAVLLMAFKQPNKSTLTIRSDGFNNDDGTAMVLLFRKGDKIPGSPFKTLSVEIRDHKANFEIPGLPYNDYAVILLHDGNNNGKIDHLLGLPNEQLGYSNNWKLGFFTGMPTFNKLKFTFTAGSTIQNINISYKKNK